MKKPFRKALRWCLKLVTKLAIRKHRPTIIAIVGDGETSLVREYIFAVINTTHPARQNRETPEAELSVPLTVINYSTYPGNVFAWSWALAKTLARLIKNRPHEHFLVLELDAVNQRIQNYWLDVLHPTLVIDTGKITGENLLRKYSDLAKDVGEKFGVDPEIAEAVLSEIKFPKARIRFVPGKNEALIIDSTHYYFPVSIKSVVELASEEQRKILISSNPHDLKYLKEGNLEDAWMVNPSRYTPEKGDLIVLRGQKTHALREYEYLFEKKVVT